MTKSQKEIESLKTEVTSLKIRLRRLEDFLLCIPDPEDYIVQSEAEDELIEEAKEVVLQYEKASVSLLQRRLEIGYARAERLIKQLENEGFISKADGIKPRDVLKKKK